MEHSPHQSVDTINRSEFVRRPVPGCEVPGTDRLTTQDGSTDRALDGVNTRRMASMVEQELPVRPPRPRFDLGLLPRITSNALSANRLCFILHPNSGDTIVAEGRTGGSWKSPSQKFGLLCAEGQQMVQIHRILVPNLPLIFIEERQPFTLMDHAVVKPSGSSVYVKWNTQLLWKKPKNSPATKTTQPSNPTDV